VTGDNLMNFALLCIVPHVNGRRSSIVYNNKHAHSLVFASSTVFLSGSPVRYTTFHYHLTSITHSENWTFRQKISKLTWFIRIH